MGYGTTPKPPLSHTLSGHAPVRKVERGATHLASILLEKTIEAIVHDAPSPLPCPVPTHTPGSVSLARSQHL